MMHARPGDDATMKLRIALAALLAASALSPAIAQVQAEMPGEPTPIPEQAVQRMTRDSEPRPEAVQLPQSQVAQADDQRQGRRGGGWQERRERQEQRSNEGAWQGRQSRGDGGGWQRRAEMPTPQVQTPAATPQPMPPQAERRWQRPEGSPNPGWQGRARGDWGNRWNRAERGQGGWQRTPQVADPQPAIPQSTPPVVQQDQRRWDGNRTRPDWNNGQVRRDDTWRDPQQGWNRQREGRGWNDGRRWDGDRNWNENRRWQDNRRWNDNRNYGWNTSRQHWDNRNRGDTRAWNRGWRNDNRYDWQRWRYSNRDLFRGHRYYAPHGWDYGYRRFSIGVTLWGRLYDQNYWIDDPWSYRLPQVWGPYRWVRYYNDVLLVDLRSGRVVDAIHDFFW